MVLLESLGTKCATCVLPQYPVLFFLGGHPLLVSFFWPESGRVTVAWHIGEALRILFFDSNDLEGEIPPGLGGLPALSKLDMRKNHLTGPTFGAFSDLFVLLRSFA